MRYKFYYKNDKFEDALGYIEADNIKEAEKIASKIKQLSLDKFLELFKVKKV
jgi:hypothetical protein